MQLFQKIILIFAADSGALCIAVQIFVVNNRSVMLFSCKSKTWEIFIHCKESSESIRMLQVEEERHDSFMR